jgi:hypothetical protein
MTSLRNKKVLCFIDEYGTAGTKQFCLGAVFVLAREAGRADRCFSGLLENNANEIHAADMDDGYLQGLLRRFWSEAPKDRIVLINNTFPQSKVSAPMIYAQAVVETVKIGLKRFQKDVLGRSTIGNVEVITDRNHQNNHPKYHSEISKSQAHDGRFKGVNHVVASDSAAFRLLQLADIVGYSRKWVNEGSIRAQALRDIYGIQMP